MHKRSYDPAIPTKLPIKKCLKCGETYPEELDECPFCMTIPPIKARARMRKGRKRIEDEWYRKQVKKRSVK